MPRSPKISKLSDEFGNYRLSILCLRCGNERICEPGVIAAKVGWDCSLDGLGQRLKCGKCGAKVVKIEALPATINVRRSGTDAPPAPMESTVTKATTADNRLNVPRA